MAYTGGKFSKEELWEIAIDAVTVLLGDYNTDRKQAAILLLKAILPHEVVRGILEEDGIYPFSRDDPRVYKWRKAVLSRGRCEECGATEGLEAHHILKWCDYPKGRSDIKNGACLCHKCHTNEHRGDICYHMMAKKK